MRHVFLIMLLLVVFIAGCQSDSAMVKDDGDVDSSKSSVEMTVLDLKKAIENAPAYSGEYEIISKGVATPLEISFDLPKFKVSTSTPEGDIAMIFDGNAIVTCAFMEGSWNCYKMAAEKPESIRINEYITSDDYTITPKGQCARALEKGTKFEITSDGYKSDICYTQDGILLEMKGVDGDMYAKSIKRSVSASDFTPPATPKDISAMLPRG